MQFLKFFILFIFFSKKSNFGYPISIKVGFLIFVISLGITFIECEIINLSKSTPGGKKQTLLENLEALFVIHFSIQENQDL